jgi:hypothetical protein
LNFNLSHQRFTLWKDDWVEVSSEPDVLDFIIRLHIRIAENQRSMGDLDRAAVSFRDAYKVSLSNFPWFVER